MPADLPFVAERAGPLAEVVAAAGVAARRWGLPTPELLRHGMNGIFAAGDDVVLRVGITTADAREALALTAVLRDAGLRVPRVVVDDVCNVGRHVVVAVERLHPSGAAIDWHEVGAMVACLHRLDPRVVPAGYPRPRAIGFPWWSFDRLLEESAGLVDAKAFGSMRAMLERHRPAIAAGRAMPLVVCHGDVHPGNVVQTDVGPVLIDWDLLCSEPNGWDHAPLATWTQRWGGEPGMYEAFAAGYGADLRSEPYTAAIAELRLLAATLMRVRAGCDDPEAAVEAERRLQWWRGDPDAPMWRAM